MAEPIQAQSSVPESTVLPESKLERRRARISGEQVSNVAFPLIVLAFFLFLWQELPGAFGFHSYEVPTLLQTLQGLHDDWSQIGTALLVTLQDAVLGFIIGNGLAILGATAFSYSRQLERAFYPIAIIVQTIPILVYAPIFVIIFFKVSVTSDQAQSYAVVAVAVLITFFPTLVNMNVGLKTIDPRVYELMQLLNASKTQIFFKLRLPSSMPFLFSSLKITSTLAFVGALVGEFMVGGGFNPIGHGIASFGVTNLFGFPTDPASAQGVGYQLQIFYSQLDKPGIFADVLAISSMSVLFFGLMILLERWLVPWQRTH